MLVIISYNVMSIYLHVCTRIESVNVVIIRRHALVVTAVSQVSLGYSHVRPVAIYQHTVIACGCLSARDSEGIGTVRQYFVVEAVYWITGCIVG